MKPFRLNASGRVSPIALIVIAAFIVGLAAWAASWHRLPLQTAASAPRKILAPEDTAVTDRAIDRALAVTQLDSVAYKSRWLDQVRGFDLSSLDAKKREVFLRFANAERCTCGCGYTLAGCKASDMTCEVSGASLQALLDSVRAGRVTSARGVRSRPRS
ncbi:MAG TPA: hypothetical protein VL123_05755 [Candidatus Udaeobacter sp.]|jgi:hypothetical protein|nr:hypothetical protein [Candidatus Udaeobacter sp.]